MKNVSGRDTTEEEIDLLLAAIQAVYRQIYVGKSMLPEREFVDCVLVGDNYFGTLEDRNTFFRYQKAVESLCAKGWAKHQFSHSTGKTYKLTGVGEEVAKNLQGTPQ